HVIRRERLAVVPLHVFLQMKDDGQSIIRDFPGFCQLRLRIEVEIVSQQTLEHLAVDIQYGSLLIESGHEQRRLRLHDQVESDCAAIFAPHRPVSVGVGGTHRRCAGTEKLASIHYRSPHSCSIVMFIVPRMATTSFPSKPWPAGPRSL